MVVRRALHKYAAVRVSASTAPHGLAAMYGSCLWSGCSLLVRSITPPERRELLDAGVRADTSTVLLSRSGEILTPPLSQRMIGITGEQLRRIPEVDAVAGGADKADAVGVVLRWLLSRH
jgi:DNA-binding transcriptional regulator LsrR (DeoR family)